MSTPVFNVMELEVIEDGNHKGICNAIQNAFKKMDRSEREIGICTNGATVNIQEDA